MAGHSLVPPAQSRTETTEANSGWYNDSEAVHIHPKMLDHTSPPPYNFYASAAESTLQSSSHGHAHLTPQANPDIHEDPICGRDFQSYGHSPCGHDTSVQIVLPTPSGFASRTVIRNATYRSDQTTPLLTTRNRRVSNNPRCFCLVLGAIIIFVVLFVVLMSSSDVTWTKLESRSCTSYATREYVAELSVSRFQGHQMDICTITPMIVHGQPHRPSKCEYSSGKVIGHFAINHDEPDCVTYWSAYKDLGCTAVGSKKRQIEQRLENLPFKAEYKEFCATTPTHFLDMEFSGAESCVKSIWGIYGKWFIDDDSC